MSKTVLDYQQNRDVEDALYFGNKKYVPEKRYKEDIEKYYVRLPLDADGVPIRPGDELESVEGTVFSCQNLYLCRDGWTIHGRLSYEVCHVKHDTVESLLTELIDNQTSEDASDMKQIIAAYAERIRRASTERRSGNA